jgi:biotin transport system substrate-specific component
MKKNIQVKDLTLTGMFAAIAVITSLISIPLPNGVALTLQTFGMAFIGYVLGPGGIWSTLIWILLGLVGLPVFAGFRGGFEVLFGFTGGFIIGFPFMTLLCGLGQKNSRPLSSLTLGMCGLAVVHLLGILQYMYLTGLSFPAAALVMSVPYLLKDIASVAAAYAVGYAVRRRLPVAAY